MARRAAVFTLVALCTFVGSVAARAQTPDFTQAIKPDDVVVVTGLDRERIIARVSSLTSSILTLDAPGGPRTLPASALGRVVVKDPLGNGTKIGLLIGAAGGALGGWALNSLCVNEAGSCPASVLAVVAFGAGIGAGVGATADAMHVRTAYRRADFPTEFSSEAGFDVGGGFIVTGGDRFRTPHSVGASWRYLNVSGVGVEFETHRSFGQALRTTPCATITVRELTNQCVGPVVEGFDNEVSSSAKLVYAFPGSGLRPYITAGGAISRLERHRPVFFIRDNQLQVFNGSGSETTAQVLVGGGVRIAVASHLSIRPDVTFAIGNGESHVRASAGVAYRW
jgi:hypothetical protein